MHATAKAWEHELEALHQQLRELFRRPEPRQRSLAYLKGLLGTVERKNGWQLAEWIGEATPDGIQHPLERAQWDADNARDVLRRYVVEELGERDAVLIVDETYYVVYAPRTKVTRQTAVNVAGRRWEIETGFEAAKGECGLDQYEVRRWQGWYRHITLALLAHAVLVTLWVRGKKT
jgi:SRSO17 transposase